MKLFKLVKDGGAESTVWAYVACEFKRLFSVMLLRFDPGSRDAYHSHAFDCVSWVLKGQLVEVHYPEPGFEIDGFPAMPRVDIHTPSLRPIVTRRETYHKVVSVGTTWVLTFRGPWSRTWKEARPTDTGAYAEVVLTHGRKEIEA
jgi:hypothetical protein